MVGRVDEALIQVCLARMVDIDHMAILSVRSAERDAAPCQYILSRLSSNMLQSIALSSQLLFVARRHTAAVFDGAVRRLF